MKTYGAILCLLLAAVAAVQVHLYRTQLHTCGDNFAEMAAYFTLYVEESEKPPVVKVDKDRLTGSLLIQIDNHLFEVPNICGMRT